MCDAMRPNVLWSGNDSISTKFTWIGSVNHIQVWFQIFPHCVLSILSLKWKGFSVKMTSAFTFDSRDRGWGLWRKLLFSKLLSSIIKTIEVFGKIVLFRLTEDKISLSSESVSYSTCTCTCNSGFSGEKENYGHLKRNSVIMGRPKGPKRRLRDLSLTTKIS